MVGINKVSIGLFLVIMFASGITQAFPILQVKKTTFDLGELPRGTSKETLVEIENKGQHDLRVSATKYCPSCFTLSSNQFVVKPQSKYIFKVAFKTDHFLGKTEKTIQLVTNAPQKKLLKLTFKCSVYELFKIKSSKISLGKIPTSTDHSVNIEIEKSRPSLAINVQLPENTDPNTFALSLSEQSKMDEHENKENKEHKLIKLDASSGIRLGPAVRSVIISAVDPITKMIVKREVKIGVEVFDVNLSHQKISFGVVRLNGKTENIKKTIILNNNGIQNFQAMVSGLPKCIIGKVRHINDKKIEIDFVFDFREFRRAGILEEYVLLRYGDDGSQVTIEVPLTAIILGSLN